MMTRRVLMMMVMMVGRRQFTAALEKRAECEMWSHLENKTMPLQVTRYTFNINY